MFEFRTQGFNGYAVKYSPFFDSRLAVATSANFGLVGNGRLYILGLTPNGIVAEKWYDTQDSLFDTAWSEAHENQVLAGSGDGTVKLFDLSLTDDGGAGAGSAAFPVQQYGEHAREVFSVHWNLVAKDRFLSSSWDGTVKVWDPARTTSLVTLPTHSCTYAAQFSPSAPSLVSAVTADSHLRLFDLRTPASAANHLTLSIPIHNAPLLFPGGGPGVGPSPPSEALTHDWNKYRPTVLATAGVDRVVRTFDLRQPRGPLAVFLPGHDYAVRKLAWSPHLPDLLLTASYDMTCRLWRDGMGEEGGGDSSGVSAPPKEVGRMDRHTEFVTGVDWCLFGAEGWCASCAWDERVLVWDVRAFMGPG